MGTRLAVGAGSERGPRADRLHAGRIDCAAIRPRLSGRGEGPGVDDRRRAAQDTRRGLLRDAAARRGGPEGLRRVAGVSAACPEVRGARIARAIDGAAPPGGPTVPVPRPENDRCLRRTRSDRKSTRLNSSHGYISYAVFCLKKKKKNAR